MSATPFYTLQQEKYNIITHLVGMAFFIVSGFFLLQKGGQITSAGYKTPTILLVSLLGSVVGPLMNYTASVCYHAANPKNRLVFRKFDHISIFWSIAGVYLPFIAVNYELTNTGFWLFFLMIGLAVAGTFFKVFFLHVNKLVYTFLYVLMGWAVVFFGKEFYSLLPASTLILLIAGGICYTIGVGFYLSKRFYYSHAIWHVFVVLGGVSHFFSIWFLIDKL